MHLSAKANYHIGLPRSMPLYHPALKSLDIANMANFRPVSNLLFLSKVVEKAIAGRLTDHLFNHKFLSCRRSAYRRHRSTETAMLTVLDLFIRCADSWWQSTSDAAWSPRHVSCIRLRWAQSSSGASRKELRLDQSRFAMAEVVTVDRTKEVFYNGGSTTAQRVHYGVP